MWVNYFEKISVKSQMLKQPVYYNYKLEWCIDDERQLKMAKRPQAPFSAITSLFSSQIEKNSTFGISEFFYVPIWCKFSIFVMVTEWRDHFSAPFRGLYLPNAWSQTPQTSKRHIFRVSAFHRCHWFG